VKNFQAFIVAAVLGSVFALGQPVQPLAAQPVPEASGQSQAQPEQQAAPPPSVPESSMAAPRDEPICGSWETGTWVPTGACGANDYRSHVSGTVTAVKGHLVTLQQTTKSLVINDQPALDQRTTGRVAVGRQVVAVGFWRNGTFYATLLR
jgi:hypothetical protein